MGFFISHQLLFLIITCDSLPELHLDFTLSFYTTLIRLYKQSKSRHRKLDLNQMTTSSKLSGFRQLTDYKRMFSSCGETSVHHEDSGISALCDSGQLHSLPALSMGPSAEKQWDGWSWRNQLGWLWVPGCQSAISIWNRKYYWFTC